MTQFLTWMRCFTFALLNPHQNKEPKMRRKRKTNSFKKRWENSSKTRASSKVASLSASSLLKTGISNQGRKNLQHTVLHQTSHWSFLQLQKQHRLAIHHRPQRAQPAPASVRLLNWQRNCWRWCSQSAISWRTRKEGLYYRWGRSSTEGFYFISACSSFYLLQFSWEDAVEYLERKRSERWLKEVTDSKSRWHLSQGESRRS